MNIFCTGNQNKKNFYKTLIQISEISKKYNHTLYLNEKIYNTDLSDSVKKISFQDFYKKNLQILFFQLEVMVLY